MTTTPPLATGATGHLLISACDEAERNRAFVSAVIAKCRERNANGRLLPAKDVVKAIEVLIAAMEAK